MDFFTNGWGDLASVIGLFLSAVGLGWAIIEARGARSAAQAAEPEAEQARIERVHAIERHLLTTDVNRAVDLIQRLKLLHGIGRWDGALEQYQSLRSLITSILFRLPEQYTRSREELTVARVLIRKLEDRVSSWGPQEMSSEDVSKFNQELNEIQSDLENVPATEVFGR